MRCILHCGSWTYYTIGSVTRSNLATKAIKGPGRRSNKNPYRLRITKVACIYFIRKNTAALPTEKNNRKRLSISGSRTKRVKKEFFLVFIRTKFKKICWMEAPSQEAKQNLLFFSISFLYYSCRRKHSCALLRFWCASEWHAKEKD